MVCATTSYFFIQQDKVSRGNLYKHLLHNKPQGSSDSFHDGRDGA